MFPKNVKSINTSTSLIEFIPKNVANFTKIKIKTDSFKFICRLTKEKTDRLPRTISENQRISSVIKANNMIATAIKEMPKADNSRTAISTGILVA